MVAIAPFRGVIYNKEEIDKHGGLLLAPPYDVLTEEEQKNCLNLSPHNILNIDYGLKLSDDDHKYSCHQRSADLLKKWLNDGILQRLDKPAIFFNETIYRNPYNGVSTVRHGFICLMKLEHFSKDSHVRPHEKTFSSHKEERLSLMKHTGANLSQVFGFFPDEDRKVLEQMNTATSSREPDIDVKDYHGFGHRMWINQDEEVISNLVGSLKERRVYIADGHHRYETALNYRKWLEENNGQIPASANYLMIYLCPMSDPGLVILPTHRLLNKANIHPDEMINRLSRYFKISGKSFNSETEENIRERFLCKLRKQQSNLGLYLADRKTYYVLKLFEAAKKDAALASEPNELAALNTVILSNIVFMRALGLTEQDLDNPDIISYVSDLGKALNVINENNQSEAAFILNPTTVEDILKVTEKGMVMPRKSTFFYPKVTTGLVLNIID